MKKGKKVLTEEEFTEKLSSLIERDYFPDLPKLRTRLEYATALENNDLEAIQITAEALKKEESKNDKIDPQLSKETINSFQERFCSEDNASFEDIMETARQANRERNAWAFTSNNGDARKAITAGVKTDYLEYWDHKPKNALMYYPEGLQASEAGIINQQAKSIIKENTRINHNDLQSTTIVGNNNSHVIKIKDGQEGNVKSIIESETLRLKYSPMARSSSITSPRKLGFVESTPALEPGIDATPILTWGVVEAVSKEDGDRNNESGNNTSSRRFMMPATPLREAIGDSLKNKASKSYLARRRGLTAASTPHHRHSNRNQFSDKSPSTISSASSPYRTPIIGLSSAARDLLKRTSSNNNKKK